MKILIDCSNLKVGGGIQVALSFLYDLVEISRKEEYIVVLSPEMEKLISLESFGENFSFIKVNKNMYKNYITRRKAVKNIEAQACPDVIFSIFGPSYHKSDVPKIVGFAIPHYIYTDSPYFNILSVKEKILSIVRRKIKGRFFVKNSDILIFETEDARSLFCRKFSFNNEATFVVSNKLNRIFHDSSLWSEKKFDFNTSIKFLCLGANYKHKNLQIIPKVIDKLKEHGLTNFKFIVSLTKEQIYFGSNYDSFIEYIGKIDLEDLPNLYRSIDILFMPTLLETFSATYLEAMYMKVPITTSDLDFARYICQDGAVYFDPLNPSDIVRKLLSLIDNDALRNSIIEKAKINLKRFGTSKDRTNRYLDIILKTVKSNQS